MITSYIIKLFYYFYLASHCISRIAGKEKEPSNSFPRTGIEPTAVTS